MGQSCYNEADLTPNGDEPVLSENDLPQGNHDYDKRIMDYWEDYGLLVFYKFDYKEFWWTPTADIRPKPANGLEGGTFSGFEGVQGNEKYVGKLIDLLDKEFFAYYPSEYLNKRMPKKLLLMSELTFTPASALNPDQAPKERVFTHLGYDRIAVNMANEDILSLTEDSIQIFKDELHSTFLQWQTQTGFIERSSEFTSATIYGKSYYYSNENAIRDLYKDGLICSTARTVESDWVAYITAIATHTYEELTGEIDPVIFVNGKFNASKWLSNADKSLGMLNRDPKKGWDKSGKINHKYKIITTYFKEKYNLDLQAIGNGK